MKACIYCQREHNKRGATCSGACRTAVYRARRHRSQKHRPNGEQGELARGPRLTRGERNLADWRIRATSLAPQTGGNTGQRGSGEP